MTVSTLVKGRHSIESGVHCQDQIRALQVGSKSGPFKFVQNQDPSRWFKIRAFQGGSKAGLFKVVQADIKSGPFKVVS